MTALTTGHKLALRTPERLFSIEALRGAAAIAVVFTHTAKHVDMVHQAPIVMTLFRAGHAGVDLFFTISGFIILFVHRDDIGHPEGFRRYVSRRVTRIFPLYWFALGLTIAMSVVGGHGFPTATNLLCSIFLLPTTNVPILTIAWTLQLEIIFYSFFALLIISRVIGLISFTLWFILIAAVSLEGAEVATASPFFSPFNLEFFLGMAAAGLLQMARLPQPRVIALLGSAAFLGVYITESCGIIDGYSTAGRLAYGLPAATLVLGLAAAEQAGKVNMARWLRVLGGASYAIYLFQFVFIGCVWQIVVVASLQDQIPGGCLFAILSSACVVFGVLTSRLIERPLLRAIRRLYPGGPKASGNRRDQPGVNLTAP